MRTPVLQKKKQGSILHLGVVPTRVCIHTHLSFCMFVGSVCVAFSTMHVQHSKNKQKQNKQYKKRKQPKRFLLALGIAYQRQTCRMQQAGGRQSIGSESQLSTTKHSEAQGNTEKHSESEHSKAHSIAQHSTAEDTTRQNAKIQRSIAHSMRHEIQHSTR